MSHLTRATRRHTIDLRQLALGDYIILVASVILFFALLLNWWASGQNVNAFQHSWLYAVITLVFLLITIVLVTYPLFQPEFRLPPLPVATPPLLLILAFLILLSVVYELGRYVGVDNVGIAPGFGLWLAFIASLVYLLGALIKWGARLRAHSR
jgi:magnesium-transporting ATPase (P-type)